MGRVGVTCRASVEIDNLLLWENGQFRVECLPALWLTVGLRWILVTRWADGGGGSQGRGRVTAALAPRMSVLPIDIEGYLVLLDKSVLQEKACLIVCLGSCSLLAESPGWGVRELGKAWRPEKQFLVCSASG